NMNVLKNIIFYSCLILITSLSNNNILFAQTTPHLLRGKVVDKFDKLSVIGAAVTEIDKEKRTISGVVTDIDGNFALKIKDPNNRIIVSYLGYKTLELPINGRTTINISLESNQQIMQEVTVTADKPANTGLMNIAQRDLTTASVSISAKLL